MSAEVERFEGTVAQYIGDELYALFGAPLAHEDDSERAVRSALAIQRALGRYAQEVEAAYGVSLAVRIAINTGPVVIRPESEDPYNAVGDTVNVASRIQKLVDGGEIVVGPSTKAQIQELFELAEMGEQDLRGVSEPIETFRVLGVRRGAGREVEDASRRQGLRAVAARPGDGRPRRGARDDRRDRGRARNRQVAARRGGARPLRRPRQVPGRAGRLVRRRVPVRADPRPAPRLARRLGVDARGTDPPRAEGAARAPVRGGRGRRLSLPREPARADARARGFGSDRRALPREPSPRDLRLLRRARLQARGRAVAVSRLRGSALGRRREPRAPREPPARDRGKRRRSRLPLPHGTGARLVAPRRARPPAPPAPLPGRRATPPSGRREPRAGGERRRGRAAGVRGRAPDRSRGRKPLLPRGRAARPARARDPHPAQRERGCWRSIPIA